MDWRLMLKIGLTDTRLYVYEGRIKKGIKRTEERLEIIMKW